ncbi:MAG: hypothetical protein NW201_12670 [Gemmatimonadales bacterium]|nr:hypothetical protein [Gemmatimonadales bacterium]
MSDPLDLDWRLRLAVFAHLAELRGVRGIVTSDELDKGIDFEGARWPLWNRQKGIYAPGRQRGGIGIALTIQTSYESPYDDDVDGDGDTLHYRYRGTDPHHADNVALRRAGELDRPIVYLVGVAPGRYEALFPVYVTADDPARLTFALRHGTAAGLRGPAHPDPAAESLERRYQTRAVQQRLHQRRFREQVLDAYARRCCVCRLRHEPLLDAAHIIADSAPHGLPEVPNGLAMCKIHHGAFDALILGVSPDYEVRIRADVLEEVDGPMLKHGLQELHGSRIELPGSRRLRPRAEYLAERFERFRAA